MDLSRREGNAYFYLMMDKLKGIDLEQSSLEITYIYDREIERMQVRIKGLIR